MPNKKSIIYRLKQQLKELQSQIGGEVEIRTHSSSGEEGRFDYIRKFYLGENSFLGLRIKHDDVSISENKINFYALRYMKTKEERKNAKSRYSRYGYPDKEYQKPLFSSSVDITYERLIGILNKIVKSSSSKYQIIEILNQEKIFDFDLGVLLLSEAKFKERLSDNSSENDLIFKNVCDKLLLLSKQSVLKEMEIVENIKIEVENLNKDEEYLFLLKEREKLDQLISQKTKKLDMINKEHNELKRKMDVLSYFERENKELELDKRKNEQDKKQILNVIIQDMIYSKRFDLFEKECFPKLPEDTNQRLTFSVFK